MEPVEEIKDGKKDVIIESKKEPLTKEGDKTEKEEKKLTKNQKLKMKKKARKAKVEEGGDDNFEEELKWCIEQINTGIRCNKLDKEQCIAVSLFTFSLVSESSSVLSILTSTKEPLVKKRQLMYTVFGDYRKLMRDSRFQIKKESVL